MVQDPTQLSLGLNLRDAATFANFYPLARGHTMAVSALKAIAAGEENSPHLIWGASGCGITHLMQAVCHHGSRMGKRVVYLPLVDIRAYQADEFCEGLESTSLICIDGIDCIGGDRLWEEALFHLFNRVRDSGGSMLIGAHTSPPAMPLAIADLKSRILGCVVYQLASLSDEEKQEVLVLRARSRGMDLPSDVAKFIMTRASRDMNELLATLDQLDRASIQFQRKLTIPFVKQALSV